MAEQRVSIHMQMHSIHMHISKCVIKESTWVNCERDAKHVCHAATFNRGVIVTQYSLWHAALRPLAYRRFDYATAFSEKQNGR